MNDHSFNLSDLNKSTKFSHFGMHLCTFDIKSLVFPGHSLHSLFMCTYHSNCGKLMVYFDTQQSKARTKPFLNIFIFLSYYTALFQLNGGLLNLWLYCLLCLFKISYFAFSHTVTIFLFQS